MIVQLASKGTISITIWRQDFLLPVKEAGFINHTHDGSVTIGDLTCDNTGSKILYSFSSFSSFQTIFSGPAILISDLSTLESPVMKILDGNLKDFHLTFKVKAITNSQYIECLKLFEFCNHVAFSILFCPRNQTLVFRFAGNSFLKVDLQHGHENEAFVLKEDKSLKILVSDKLDSGNFNNYKSKTLEFAKLQAGFKPQLTIFNETKEHLIKVYDFYCSVEV